MPLIVRVQRGKQQKERSHNAVRNKELSRFREKHMERGNVNLEVLLSNGAANKKTIIDNHAAV